MLTLRMDDGRWGTGGREDDMQPVRGLLGGAAEGHGKRDVSSSLGFDVEDRPARDFEAEHFFETDGLGEELDVVVIPFTPAAPLIFDGERNAVMELDDIGNPLNAQPMRNEPEASGSGKRALVGVFGFVNPTMIERPGEGMNILDPNFLHAMKEAAALAEEKIIESRQRREVIAVG